MLERKTVEIYACDRVDATICITYEVEHLAHRKYVSHYDFWIREDKQYDFEIVNIANKLLHKIKYYENCINGSNHNCMPLERDIYRAYQELYATKLWENYKVTKKTFSTKRASRFMKPYRNFVTFDENSMMKLANKEIAKYQKLEEGEI